MMHNMLFKRRQEFESPGLGWFQRAFQKLETRGKVTCLRMISPKIKYAPGKKHKHWNPAITDPRKMETL